MSPTRRLIALPALLLVLLLTACGQMAMGSRNPRDQALYDYAGAIRWSEFDAALEFVDPLVREAEPLSDLERERFKQVQVTGYLVKSQREPAEDVLEQLVEIRLLNRNTQTERVITDRQRWRYDAELKRWWLVSGLPEIGNP